MNRKNMIKLILFVLSAVPALLKTPWLTGAWKSSPLDSFDPLFIVAALLTGIVFVNNIKRQAKEVEWAGIIPVILFIAGMGIGANAHINLVYTASALLFSASMLWLLWGWRIFIRVLPLYLILLLALPSTTYWSGAMLQQFAGADAASGIIVKFAAALILIAFTLCQEAYDLQPAKSTVFYFLGLLIWGGSLTLFFEKPALGVPLNPRIVGAPSGKWLGEEAELDAVERSFYEGQNAKRFLHYSDAGIPVASLVVNVSGDIHKVHPFELCLRSANWTILNSESVEINMPDGAAAVKRITASKNNRKYIFYLWYSSPRYSTNAFAFFRSKYSPVEKWTIYQVFTPAESANAKDADQRITDFIRTYVGSPSNPKIR